MSGDCSARAKLGSRIIARALRIVAPGILSTVQDCGRRGVARFGVTPSGAADWYSARAANVLAGNAQCAALIEATMTGMSFEVLADARIAVTGARAPLAIDGAAADLWRSHALPAGAHVTLGAAERGVRSYVAVEAGIEVPLILGSAATDLGAGFGGFEGRALRAGDILPLGTTVGAPLEFVVPERSSGSAVYPPESIPHWAPTTALRVLPGPHSDMLSKRAWTALFAKEYGVSSRSTRQGLQLEGEPLDLDRPTGIVSAGACAGCVQITSAGLPVVLLVEHQTTGGYAMAACVITADLPRVAQLRASDRVRFELVTQVDAAHALAALERTLGM